MSGTIPPPAPRGPHTLSHYLADVPDAVVDGYVEETGIARLHAWQSRCLEETALLAGGNVVVSVNTAGGKSLVAEVALLRAAFRGDDRAKNLLAHTSWDKPSLARADAKWPAPLADLPEPCA